MGGKASRCGKMEYQLRNNFTLGINNIQPSRFKQWIFLRYCFPLRYIYLNIIYIPRIISKKNHHHFLLLFCGLPPLYCRIVCLFYPVLTWKQPKEIEAVFIPCIPYGLIIYLTCAVRTHHTAQIFIFIVWILFAFLRLFSSFFGSTRRFRLLGKLLCDAAFRFPIKFFQ